jgi:hypothetical protein
LFEATSKVPWDTYKDQDAGIASVKRMMGKGHTAHCFDLQNATDLFPLSTQTYLVYLFGLDVLQTPIERALLESQLRLFTLAARSEWHFESGVISWTRGQPLGLYPSFPLFSLTHGALLYSLYLDLPLEDRNGYSFRMDTFVSEKKSYSAPAIPPFLILGDDVVIFSDSLAERYKDALAKLEVPISLEKSLSSNIIAEFAGHLISFNTVYEPTKWRQVSHESFLSFLKVWG